MYKSIELLNEEIAAAREKIKIIQSHCKHINKTSESKANTGNYDRSEDSYWIVYDCPDCGKHWSVDQ